MDLVAVVIEIRLVECVAKGQPHPISCLIVNWITEVAAPHAETLKGRAGAALARQGAERTRIRECQKSHIS